MIIYDKAYNEVKLRYLIPLSSYNVNYRSLRKTNIKSIILSSFTTVEKTEKNDFLFYFDEDVLLKAMLGDIELFLIKMLLHNQDVTECNNANLTPNWNIVTHYYYSYFYASLLLRLCFRGNIFFDDETRKTLVGLMSQILGDGNIVLDSNLFYNVKKSESRYVLCLSKSEANTHEVVWKKTDELMKELLSYSRDNSDEKTIISNIIKTNSKLGVTYPSKLRNRVNYQTAYGLDSVDNKFHKICIVDDWRDFFFVPANNLTSDDAQAKAMFSYTKYIEWFCSNLINEYYEIQGKENGVLKNINKNRENKIKIQDFKTTFL